MKNKKFLLGAAIGAVAGALAGVLFAPKSGKETRKVIKDTADRYAQKGGEVIKDEMNAAKAVFDDKKDDIKKVIKETADKISDKVSEEK